MSSIIQEAGYLEKARVEYEYYLKAEEKSSATIEKYMRDIRKFIGFSKGKGARKGEAGYEGEMEPEGAGNLSKELVLDYKEDLIQNYAPASVNSMLVALNGFLAFLNRPDCCVRTLKIQRQIFANEEKELSQAEYQRLLRAANGTQLYYILQTISATGIRISELEYITAEAVHGGKAQVNCKGKRRVIFLSGALQKSLKSYMTREKVEKGSIFVTRGGKPLNRSNIWRSMKSLCQRAGVDAQKVFPHNLRHLFARVFYGMEKDIVRLADILGHSSVNTSRIYTMETGDQHRKCLERIQKELIT